MILIFIYLAYVKRYLDRTFYDLTTVALHDWKAYSEMRNLADQKYNLNLIDPYLPSSTLEQVRIIQIIFPLLIYIYTYFFKNLGFRCT